ncbi:hypothetical protein EVAR_86442_1 [Eumeta japonica]|uniref:Uncharacterized protein n=1 Tax=Eumeta variegata TaxID=151549 RepID=A0A4C1ZT43_EUMVA|nr:hypothetical protein EVAR_86442_1 [Eumeta japonica]
MKDASKRFFDIAGSHPNALLRAAIDYQPPPPTHFLRVVHRASRAVGTHVPSGALGEAIKGVRPVARLVVCHHSIADKVTSPSGEFFSGFQPHTTHAYGREGVRDRHFIPPPRRKW